MKGQYYYYVADSVCACMYIYACVRIKYAHVHTCTWDTHTCILVGSCLATKAYRQFAGYGKGLGHHKVGQ